MAVFAELADGRRLEFPDGTDPSVVQATVKRMVAGDAPRAPTESPQELSWAERNLAPMLESVGGAITRAKPLMPPPVRGVVDIASNPAPVVQGMADPAVGITQLVAEMLGQGDAVTPRVQAQERAYQRSRGDDAGSFDLARTVASIANPLPLKAATMVKPAATILGKVGQGAAIGGGFGTAQPVYDEDFWNAKATQALAGSLFGGALPLAAEGAKGLLKGAHNVFEPWLPGGRGMIVGRTANKAAGARQGAVVSALEADQQIMKGSAPTAGEAAVPAGSAEFAGLQRIMEGRDASGYLARDIEQNKARLGAVREVGGTKDALAAAETNRRVAAGRNYERAYGKEIKADPELAQLSANPYFQDALPIAFKLAKAEKFDPKSDQTRFLHFVKLALDANLTKAGEKALDSTQRQATQDVKTALVNWIGKKNPAYDAARTEFAKDSVPVNQMQIGQFLEKKLEPALNAVGEGAKAQRADLYSTAVREAPQTIKSASGRSMFDDFKSAGLTDEQIGKVEGVAKDLARSANYEDMGRRGSEAANRLVGGTLDPKQLPNALHRPIMIINAVLKRVQGSAEGRTLDEIAKKMQDPKEMARMMRAATEQERHGILATLFGAVERAGAPVAAAEGAVVGKGAAGEPPEKPQRVADAPRNPNERVVGAIYKTPKGLKEWSENGWLTPRK